MGTLTGGQPRLPGYCDHKLPTSCRLSSIPECCACADERAHAASYSTYIDGIGFVLRGTRWQRYCWFCKEFWENRVQASGLRPGQTRIPEVPDQSGFLEKWYDFHRGFRTIMREDGVEERVAVLGEDFRDVSPGYLPRTLEEMRAGRQADLAVQVSQQPADTQERNVNGPSLDEALDQMFEEASIEDAQQQPPARNVQGQAQATTASHDTQLSRYVDSAPVDPQPPHNTHAQAMVPAASRNREYQARRIAALRRELHRMRNGIERVISGLRDLGENVPDAAEATGRLTDLGRTLDAIDGPPSHEEAERAINSVNALTDRSGTSRQDRTLANIQGRVDEARQHLNEARRMRDQAASELDVAESEFRTSQQRLQQLQREQRTTENYLRLFGTREEMQAAGENYESPIGGMFTRAYERFRAAEEVRREERVLRQVLQDEASAGGEGESARLAELEARQRDVWGVPRPSAAAPSHQLENDEEVSQEPRGELEEYYAMLRRQNWNQQAPQSQTLGHAVEATLPATNQEESQTERTESEDQRDNFPNNMLNAVVSAREQEAVSRDADLRTSSITPEEEFRRDAEHILLHLGTDAPLRESQLLESDDITRLLARLMHNSLPHDDRTEVEALLNTPSVIWASGVVSTRFMRRRRANEIYTFMVEPHFREERFVRFRSENVECMAEAFQMSAEVRTMAPRLTGPQRLQMLYRLQAGTRREDDVATLTEMIRDGRTVELARSVHEQSFADLPPASTEAGRQTRLDEGRRQAARQGDHSREELNAQRRATQAFAVAAGRTAMQTGPRALLERMADRDDETRAAYQRLQENGFDPEALESETDRLIRYTVYRPVGLPALDHSVSEPESEEEDEAQGLDAKDSGRPDPKTDEDMTVKMECRICYTQVAEIACLPCGHLVMCKWCSEQHSPVLAHDRTRPRRAAGCPVCRKGIRQKVRVFRA